MATDTLTHPETGMGGGGDPGGRDWNGDSGGDGYSEPRGFYVPQQAYRTGMWLALASIVMLFASLTSALVVRRGFSNDWIPLRLPGILWLNTLMLLASSLTLELSRKAFTTGRTRQFAAWWYATAGLGAAFILGQWIAWRQLAAGGIFLASNPSSSFFYLLTATHGLHLLGGVCALAAIIQRSWRHVLSQTAIDVCAIYWHFMAGLWVFLFLLLFLGR